MIVSGKVMVEKGNIKKGGVLNVQVTIKGEGLKQ